MENEKILRTSVFGGFKKDDVLKYVEELKKEISDLTGEIKSKADSLKALNTRINALSFACEGVKETEKALQEAKEEISVLNAENDQLRTDNLAYSERMAAIDAEENAIEEKLQQVKASEAQLGAAFLDARKYSDEIVTAANEKANQTQADAADSIAEQAAEVARLSADVDKLADILNKSITALHADISALSLKLTKSAQTLKNQKDAERFVPDISIKIENELGKNLQSIAAEDADTFALLHRALEPKDDAPKKNDSILHFDHTKEG